jgi:GxxExxY protein
MIEPSQELDTLAHTVIGAAIEVHRVLGPGYLESTYEEALAVELRRLDAVYEQQFYFDLQYKGERVGQGRVDLLVANQLVVELKAVDAIATVHQAQLLSYLKALDLQLGLLINFNVPLLKDGVKRIVRT